MKNSIAKHAPVSSIRLSKSQSGLSLIDLMITIAIVSITAGLTLPSLGEILAETRAEMYLRHMARTVMYSRNQAINSGQAVTICPLEGSLCIDDWSQNVSVFVDPNMDQVRSQNERLLKKMDEINGRDFFSYPRIGVTFRPDGSINGFQSGTFRYCPNDKSSVHSKGLVINQAGRSRFRDNKVKCK